MKSQALNYVYLLLGSAALSTILVMDEEVLVLLCWVIFVCLSYGYGSEAINQIFEDRRKKFYKDIAISYDIKEETLKVLINYHIIQVLVISEIQSLFNFSKLKINQILNKRQASFKFIIASQIEQKLSILADKEAGIAAQVQESITQTVSSKVLELFKSKDKSVTSLKEKILSESMTKFENITKA